MNTRPINAIRMGGQARAGSAITQPPTSATKLAVAVTKRDESYKNVKLADYVRINHCRIWLCIVQFKEGYYQK